MTKRTAYRAEVPRCQAITQKKTRCTRDATHMHAGKGYCANHHGLILALKACGKNLGLRVMRLEGKI